VLAKGCKVLDAPAATLSVAGVLAHMEGRDHEHGAAQLDVVGGIIQ
jgi:hypothetical protein